MMGIMQAPGDPKKKKLLTPKRTLEIADSLYKEGYNKLEAAQEAKKYGLKSVEKEMNEKGYIDLKNESRYRKLAEAKKKSN